MNLACLRKQLTLKLITLRVQAASPQVADGLDIAHPTGLTCVTGGTANVAKTKLAKTAEAQIGGSDGEEDCKHEAARKAVDSMCDAMGPLVKRNQNSDDEASDDDPEDDDDDEGKRGKRRKGKAKAKAKSKGKRTPKEMTPEAGNCWFTCCKCFWVLVQTMHSSVYLVPG